MVRDASSLHCPNCGAAADPNLGRCPYCQARLATVSCPACFGLMFDVRFLLEMRDGEGAAAGRRCRGDMPGLHRLSIRTPSRSSETVRYRPCVRCGKMMNRVNFGKRSGAVVDVCRGHGTFLDAGELHQIVTFIQNGGLERARAQQLEDLCEEERRLKSLETRVMLEQSGKSRSSWEGADLLSLIESIARNSQG